MELTSFSETNSRLSRQILRLFMQFEATLSWLQESALLEQLSARTKLGPPRVKLTTRFHLLINIFTSPVHMHSVWTARIAVILFLMHIQKQRSFQ